MSYLFELRTSAGARYMVTDGASREEALAQVHEQLQLGMDDEEEEVVVFAVHTVH